MKALFIFIVALALIDAGTRISAEEKTPAKVATREIPLSTIWGNVSSDSLPLRKLEPEYFIYRDTPESIKKYETLTPQQIADISRKAEASYSIQIERALRALDASNNKPRSGFAVEGRGHDALKGIYEVLVKGKAPVAHFKRDADISLAFFSYPAQPLVHLNHIELTGSTIHIQYLLIAHGEQNLTSALAILPLGKLAKGKYLAQMIRQQSHKLDEPGYPPVQEKLENRIVCGDFEFVIGEDE